MRIRSQQLHAGFGKINVTPLIDVVMVLIVFYLIVGRLASDRVGGVQLPRSATGETASALGVVISVRPGKDPGNTQSVLVAIDGRDVPMDVLLTALRARMPELESGGPQREVVQLRADRRLSYGAIRPVVSALREAGVTTLKLVSSPTEAAP